MKTCRICDYSYHPTKTHCPTCGTLSVQLTNPVLVRIYGKNVTISGHAIGRADF